MRDKDTYFRVQTSENQIFGIVDIQECATKSSPATIYTNLRGIFLQILNPEEILADSHEDILLFLSLIIIHPGGR